MICLAIESTAHTFGASVVEYNKKTEKFNVLTNVRDMYKTEKGGIIPVQLSEHHVECFDRILQEALKNTSIKDIDLIAFSQGPGMGHALRIGANAARSLSLQLNKPLIGVNHCVAHLEIGCLEKAKDSVLLYASGANTQIIAYDGGKYRIFGETLDIGIGNFLDNFGRELGLGFPAGPKIDEMAKKAKARNAKYIELPYSVKGMDVSFSGMLTNLKQKIQNAKTHEDKEDLCYSVQETIFAMLLEVSERAMAHCEKTELLLGGGVACNSRLKEMSEIMCKERNAKLFIPEFQFLVDNAGMIGVLGIKMFNAGNKTSIKNSAIRPYERTDDVKVNWKK